MRRLRGAGNGVDGADRDADNVDSIGSVFQPKVDSSSPPEIIDGAIIPKKIVHASNKSTSSKTGSHSGSRTGSRSGESRTSSSAYNYVRAVVKTPNYDNVHV